MKLIKVGAAVLNQTPLDWDGNQSRIRAAIEASRREGVTVLCLPELCISGYGCEDAFHAPGLHDTSLEVLHELLPATRGMLVSLGLPLMHHNGLFNSVCLVVDGSIAGFVAKRFLAGDGIHYEPRWFKPWPEGAHSSIRLHGVSYPIGDVFFDVGDVRIGFEVCEDAWAAKRPGSDLALKGVDVILNPSASHFAFEKIHVRRRFVIEGSRAFCVSYVYSNLLGNEAGRAIYDGGALIASAGKLLASGPRFSCRAWQLTTAVIDVDSTRMQQARTGSFRPVVDKRPEEIVQVPFSYPKIEPETGKEDSPLWESSVHFKEEEFTRAVALALLDYMRKSFSKGFVVSLSGGADSAACACLVALMVQLGVRELGIATFLRRLDYFDEIQRCESTAEITERLLLCVYQSTRNSSESTYRSALQVANGVAARFLCFDVDPQVESYVSMVGAALDRELTWQTDDLALQNIQARARAPGAWMLANIYDALLLATSNRSEAAVGYATMDGDTSGGLSPIAGIDKAFLRRWLRWLESEGPDGLGPIPALKFVNEQQPTAELRPSGAGQTDEDDLMPYEVLDAIERLAIRDKQMPLEAFLGLRKNFPQHPQDLLVGWVERFFELWCRNQWKRERYAPSFHVDDENLDPKTWCRFPILSGGFRRELSRLRTFVSDEKRS